MARHRKRNNLGGILRNIFVPLTGLIVLIAVLLQGKNIALFNPKGAIAQEQHNLMLITVGIMLIIAIPTLFLLYFFAWKYRESNHTAMRERKARRTWRLDMSMWLIPCIFMVVLASIMWSATHRLEPHKPIAADVKPLTIQVVAMRWKWLFIYPEQNIATVNYLKVPVDTPLEFQLTADESPMSSFWIPNLGGMLYAMTGHVNQLNLIADTPGDYPGGSGEINGPGFSGMKFTASVTSEDDFDAWVAQTKYAPDTLNDTAYRTLLEPSEKHPVTLYAAAKDDLYDTVLKKYTSEGHGHHE
jgi:cytochrome o ubiquinol oxidase subunit II